MENFTVLGGRGVTGVPQESHRGILMGLEVWEGDGSRWGYLRKIYPPVYIRAKDPPPHPVALFVRSRLAVCPLRAVNRCPPSKSRHVETKKATDCSVALSEGKNLLRTRRLLRSSMA